MSVSDGVCWEQIAFIECSTALLHATWNVVLMRRCRNRCGLDWSVEIRSDELQLLLLRLVLFPQVRWRQWAATAEGRPAPAPARRLYALPSINIVHAIQLIAALVSRQVYTDAGSLQRHVPSSIHSCASLKFYSTKMLFKDRQLPSREFWMGEARNFIFGTRTDLAKSHLTNDSINRRGVVRASGWMFTF